MAEIAKVEGVSKVLNNLLRAGTIISKDLEKGLKKAGLFLQRESQKVVPVDTGNLKNSAFTRAEGAGLSTVVRVGYTANYAIFVHEDLNAAHASGKTAKFLEGPARKFRKELIQIIKQEAEF